MQSTAKTITKGLILYALMLLGLLALGLVFSKCSSKSGQLSTKPEKVVIQSLEHQVYGYKVQRIEKGVVDYINIPDYYVPGDTILITFR